jgi:DNA polymerase III subunit alpha
MATFVHLHVHSQYSLLDSTASIQALAEKAKAYGMPAVALTDHGNLFGAIDFYKQCKELKIKPIIGLELYLAPTSRLEKKKISPYPVAYHLTLLAKNKEGYHNLCKLTSIGYLEGFYYHPRVDFETLQKHAKGLICLSGCMSSPIAYQALHGTKESLEALILQYKELFGDDFYLELQRHEMTPEDIQLDNLTDEGWIYQQYQDYIAKQKKVNALLIEMGKKLNIQLVATNDCHYLAREDYKAHEILINIQSGEPCEIWQEDSQGNKQFRLPNPKRSTRETHEFYFKNYEEMLTLFHDIPEALATTLEIADKCKLDLDFSAKHYPVYTPPNLENKAYTDAERLQAVEEYLVELCQKAVPTRYNKERLEKVKEKYPDEDPMEVVRKRLEYEMNIIRSKGMCDYLLIVWDFIYWAKNQGIPMGPGRGSGAGSIICYLTGITDIEPLRFNLFFERFINPERISYPDIDVDICMERRGDVINYTLQKYGKDNVAQIITFGTMKAKMVIRDVGRTLSIPLAKVNTIVKLIPEDLNITIDKALEKDNDLRALCENDADAAKIIDIGKRLEGCIRGTGIHAAGMIISGKPLSEHIPICTAKDSEMLVTQYSMKPVEMVGMLKIDFLGLKTLTCLQICQEAVNAKRTTKVDWTTLPLDDAKTFQLLNQGKTQGIFQLESAGMQELAKQLHLDKFEEIIAVLSLYRPGPMDMIPSFIQRKHKREPIEYDHPWMGDILSETYGIMVYQEQVMQIASKLANYSLGEGDVLRRAMGKKDMKEMAKQREKFLQGAMKNDIAEDVAGRIFDKMEKFAEYGFNKSHAAAYGYLTYATAYFKAHFPGEWLAALMTCDRDDISKLSKFTADAKQMNIAALPPDINESDLHFVATLPGIRFAMGGIKGVGTNVVEAIVKERTARGPFTSLYNFVKRIDAKRVGKKAVELLIDAGCFDFTKWHRDTMKAALDSQFDHAIRTQKDAQSGVLSLFQSLENDEDSFSKEPKLAKLSSKEELLFREKALLGFFLSGHPLHAHKDSLKRMGCLSLSSALEDVQVTVFRAAFLIDEVQLRVSSKTLKKFAILTISDISGTQHELPIWPEQYEEKQHQLIENKQIIAVLAKEKKNEEVSLSCKWLCDLKELNEQIAGQCDIAYDKAKHQQARQSGYAKKEGKKEDKKGKKDAPQEKEKEKISIRLDLEKLKSSHILKLQEIITTSDRGDALVEITFLKSDKERSTLFIDPKWATSFDAGLQAKLMQVPSVVSVEPTTG